MKDNSLNVFVQATVEIDGVSASTFEADKKSKNPSWDDILSFRNFDPKKKSGI